MIPLTWGEAMEEGARRVPSMRVVHEKDAPWYVRLLFRHMSIAGITIGRTIYLGHFEWMVKDVSTLWHEVQHVEDFERWRWIFLWTYAGPLWLSGAPPVAAMWLLAPDVRSMWFTLLWAILGVICQGLRAVWEFRGYRRDLEVEFAATGRIGDDTIRELASFFWSPTYAFMLPVPPLVKWIFRRMRTRIERTGR